MNGFKDSDGKFHPTNNFSSGLHSSQADNSLDNSINISDAKTLLDMKTKGFPEPRGSVGNKSAWHIEDLPLVLDEFNRLILDETGLVPNGNFYGVSETLNGENYSAGFSLYPHEMNTGSSRHSNIKIVGVRLELPAEIDHKKWEEKLDTKIGWGVKASGYKNYFGMTINIPASNPSKINLALPFLNEMISESLTKQAENDVARNERDARHDERKVTGLDKHGSMIERLHQHGVVIGTDDYMDVIDTKHQNLDSSFETRLINPNSMHGRSQEIKLKTRIDGDANVTYSINEDYSGGGLRGLTENQAEKIIKIMLEDEE